MEQLIISIVTTVVPIYRWLIIIYILLSWVPSARESYLGTLLGKLVEPYLREFRRFIPPIGGVIDLSPIVAIFVLIFIENGIISIIRFLF
jgi:YggT family protein